MTKIRTRDSAMTPKSSGKFIDLSKINIPCEQCSARYLCFLSDHLPNTRGNGNENQVTPTVRHPHYDRGHTVFRAGDTLQALYVIRSGTLKTAMFDGDGEERILGFHLPGEMVGLEALGSGSHSCFGEVTERASLCAIPLHRLKDVLCVPRVHYEVLRAMGEEIHRREKQQVYLAYGAEKRMATFLLCLSVRLRKLRYEVRGFRLSMSRQDIANYLGLSLATTSRLLHQLQTESRIQVQNRFVDILDMEWLKHTAGECLLGDC